MKTVVITGSARGFGYACAKEFRKNAFNIVLSDINAEKLQESVKELKKIESPAKVIGVACDVTNANDIVKLIDATIKEFGSIDIFVNNAGVNQPDKPIYELTSDEIKFLINVDLIGTINGSRIAFAKMKEQGFGQIYNIEGYGSNDAMMTGLTLYGTSKRAVTYFTQALAKESKELTKGAVKVCRLTPGIMITDFITNANGGKTKIELPEKTKKIYNILGDYPETIAKYLVPRMIKNKKNNNKLVWLSNRRAFAKFFSFMFKKRNYFN